MTDVPLPPLKDLLADSTVVALPMRVRFRGITTREVMLVRGPAGWGEFGPFGEYDDDEAANWLAAAIEAAWTSPPTAVRDSVPVNATVPSVPAADVPAILARFPGATTAKVKVAEPGQCLADDVARVARVREIVPTVRVDANGGWTVAQAVEALQALTADGPLEYAEQPCRTVAELAELRRTLSGVPIAADESIRRADDPLRVLRAEALDVAVVKVAPLGGVRRLLELAETLSDHGVSVVVSSALDSAVGMAAGIRAAAALPTLDHACGLGTGGFFVRDVATPLAISDGRLAVGPVEPDQEAITELAAPRERVRWWQERLERCYRILQTRTV
ncbi:O-succinylbenzoate synthase [Skermania sp. ID1734]|uniref:o-succinylbenzoate synthase n=1 Tax=Skermania sp. ID1734 TaxID=2597516 RepID=UPI00117F3337|nr:o-succinylbenzoate synthase [Skermania sp. ID1734]TSD95112.1 O-succinylbenzoate synthase [Skermania sp. ID1734]